MSKTLYADPRGCDFRPGEQHASDVGNYRLVICITAKTGDPLIIELGGWERKDYTTRKKPVVIDANALYARGWYTEYSEKPDSYYGCDAGSFDFNFERVGVNANNYHYTRADILRFASDVSGEQYTELAFDGDKTDAIIAERYTPVEKALYAKAQAVRDKINAEKDAAHQEFLAKWRAKRNA